MEFKASLFYEDKIDDIGVHIDFTYCGKMDEGIGCYEYWGCTRCDPVEFEIYDITISEVFFDEATMNEKEFYEKLTQDQIARFEEWLDDDCYSQLLSIAEEKRANDY